MRLLSGKSGWGGFFLTLLFFCHFGFWTSPLAAQQRFVELQILASQTDEIGIQQEWMERLEEVGADRVTIRSTTRGAKADVEELESNGTITVRVIGIISGRQLQLPNARFSIQDAARIREYVQKLRDDGARVTLAEKKAFGLTSEQLVELHDDLAKPIAVDTSEMTPKQLLEKVRGELKTALEVDSASQTALVTGEPIGKNLQGLSSGTGLAYALRSAGLVLVPERKQGQTVKIVVTPAGQAAAHWPVGWEIDEPPVKVEPKLFDRIDYEIRQFRLTDVLPAIENRAGVPFLIDHNSLAEKEIDLAETRVNYSKKQTAHLTAIRAMLNQCRPALQGEIRTDENGKAFLWIY